MEAPRFDAWTRRRFGLAATGLGLVTLSRKRPYVAAAKKKKKQRKKCRKRTRSGAVTCADVCPEEGSFTFHLVGGGDVCATGADPTGCLACVSHGECSDADPLRSFCVGNFTNLATGAVGDFSGLCGPYPIGICVAFEPCVLDS